VFNCWLVKSPVAPSPEATGLDSSTLACEKETVSNRNPFFKIERNSLKQIEKWPDGDRQ